MAWHGLTSQKTSCLRSTDWGSAMKCTATSDQEAAQSPVISWDAAKFLGFWLEHKQAFIPMCPNSTEVTAQQLIYLILILPHRSTDMQQLIVAERLEKGCPQEIALCWHHACTKTGFGPSICGRRGRGWPNRATSRTCGLQSVPGADHSVFPFLRSPKIWYRKEYGKKNGGTT